MIFDGAITAFERIANNRLRVTAANHGLDNGDEVQLLNTTEYNRTFGIEKIDDQHFTVDGIRWTTGEAVNVQLESRKRRGVMFNGSDEYIAIPKLNLTPPSPEFSFGYTFSAWVNASSVASGNQGALEQEALRKLASDQSTIEGEKTTKVSEKQVEITNKTNVETEKQNALARISELERQKGEDLQVALNKANEINVLEIGTPDEIRKIRQKELNQAKKDIVEPELIKSLEQQKAQSQSNQTTQSVGLDPFDQLLIDRGLHNEDLSDSNLFSDSVLRTIDNLLPEEKQQIKIAAIRRKYPAISRSEYNRRIQEIESEDLISQDELNNIESDKDHLKYVIEDRVTEYQYQAFYRGVLAEIERRHGLTTNEYNQKIVQLKSEGPITQQQVDTIKRPKIELNNRLPQPRPQSIIYREIVEEIKRDYPPVYQPTTSTPTTSTPTTSTPTTSTPQTTQLDNATRIEKLRIELEMSLTELRSLRQETERRLTSRLTEVQQILESRTPQEQEQLNRQTVQNRHQELKELADKETEIQGKIDEKHKEIKKLDDRIQTIQQQQEYIRNKIKGILTDKEGRFQLLVENNAISLKVKFANGYQQVTDTEAIAGQWMHCAGIIAFDADSTKTTLTICKNGEQVGTTTEVTGLP